MMDTHATSSNLFIHATSNYKAVKPRQADTMKFFNYNTHVQV